MDSSVTEAQLIEEIRAAFAGAEMGPDDAMTAKELADIMGINVQRIRDQFRSLIDEGKLEMVRVRRPDWDGTMRTKNAVRMI